jgi:hypothetical protein
MLADRISLPTARRWPLLALLAACISVLIFAHKEKALAKSPTRALQGLFCNASEQIDEALRHMREGLSPKGAIGFVNHHEVVCTYVDLLQYVIDRPVVIQEIRSSFPMFKYEGRLVAVIVGNAVRPVAPPVRIFFAIPERLDHAPVEGRV